MPKMTIYFLLKIWFVCNFVLWIFWPTYILKTARARENIVGILKKELYIDHKEIIKIGWQINVPYTKNPFFDSMGDSCLTSGRDNPWTFIIILIDTIIKGENLKTFFINILHVYWWT
jgi:hypothetical protein